MNKAILKSDIQFFINANLNQDLNKILLSKSPFKDLNTKDLAQQIDGKKRCEKKLPLWFNTPEIYYPPKLNIEQSSSELTAEYKSKLVKGETLIDLTGGFGVDVLFFSKKVKEAFYVERNEELSDIAAHNSTVLGATNITFVKADSIDYLLQTDKTFGTIYIDPARRIQSQKVFLLKDTEPDVVLNLPLFLSKASRIIIKTSPLFDIQSGLRELTNVSEIHVVSVKNDCKELLWVIDRDFSGEAKIIAACLSQNERQLFSFQISDEKQLHLSTYSYPLKYIYEPDVAILKAGAFKSITERFNIAKINVNTHIYTSNTVIYPFPGKVFELKSLFTYKDWAKENSIKKANIISRNFPLSPDELKKKFKLQDGGEDFLIFCTGSTNHLIVIEARKVVQ